MGSWGGVEGADFSLKGDGTLIPRQMCFFFGDFVGIGDPLLILRFGLERGQVSHGLNNKRATDLSQPRQKRC